MKHDPLPPEDDPNEQSESRNDSTADGSGRSPAKPLPPRLAEFERVYRSEFGAVVSYFARRVEDPQLVADLTTDTFVAAIQAFESFEQGGVTPRAWAIGVARRVYSRYRESDPRGEDPERRSSLQEMLDETETKELMWRIDVERSSRELIERLAGMSAMDREVVDLVDLCGLTPAEASRELGLSSGGLRVRLLRSRARLRREGGAGA